MAEEAKTQGEGAETTPPAETEGGSDETPEPSTEPSEKKEETSEKLYAGKFKTPEELEKAYKESEKRMHIAAQEAADARAVAEDLYKFNETAPSETTEPAPEESLLEQQTYEEEFNRRVEEKAREVVNQTVGPPLARLEVAEAQAKYGKDFDRLKEHAKKIYREFPELRKPGNLDRVLRMAKAELIPEVEEAAKEKGSKETLAKVKEGRRAQTESSKGGGRESKVTLSPEQREKMSSAELLKYLPKKEE